MAADVRSGHVDVNGATLYHEIRGAGTPLLFVSMGGGDAGEWAAVADIVADKFTVVTYDRRGNSRSPKPAGWEGSPVAERSDDAAALLAELGASPALVVGCRGGATVVLDLIARHPEHLLAAVVYEPPLYLMLPDGDKVFEDHIRIAEGARAKGGDGAALESWGQLAAGEETWELLDQEIRSRIVGNAAVHWAEVPHTLEFVPDVEALRQSQGTDRRRVRHRCSRRRPTYSVPVRLLRVGGRPDRHRPS